MNHGTASCYQYHGCRCNECRRGQAEHMRRWRHGNALAASYDKRQTAAYKAALARLREAHDGEFARYYTEEREKRGLPYEQRAS